MKQKKIPLRSCIITREKLEKKELFRIVRDKEGKVFVDESYKANGRGCYLKKAEEVINKAKVSKALDRHLEVKVSSYVYDELIEILHR